VDSSGSRYGLLAGCCECDDGPSGSGATDLVKNTNYFLNAMIGSITLRCFIMSVTINKSYVMWSSTCLKPIDCRNCEQKNSH
jgi:hypothetical protein